MIQLPPSNDESEGEPKRPNGESRSNPSSMSPKETVPSFDMASVMDTLRQTKKGMQRVQDRLSEPLAIVGMGCRFPGASNPDEFWKLLSEGRAAETVAGDRWDESLRAEHEKQPGQITANRAGWLNDIDQFDASFFGISGREAASLDPQQRLLLEIAWETFENAGIVPKSCRGKRVGTFVGICSNDYLHRLVRRGLDKIDTYLSTGNAHGAAAGRLSYVMDWRGPSVAIDTACSSSLTALHLAARSLRYGDCDMAIAMGVNVILAPELSVSFSQAGMLSPTGRCHTFSSNADGFVRGEGCGAVLLKRLSDAVRDGDTIHCVIRGTATNQDGRSVGLTAPNGTAQQAVIREALHDAGMSPQQVDYIEAHGTGTPLGDPIEVDALRQVFSPTRGDDRPLQLGSVKTNLGHLEGAAGMAGVIKVALAIKNHTLPAHLHCDQPSESIDWQWPVEITTQPQQWSSKLRVAGVSSFGFGGSNAHIILSDAPVQNPLSASAVKDGTIPGDLLDEQRPTSPESLFVLSAKSVPALRQYAQQFADHFDRKSQRLPDICYSAATTREVFDHRIAFVVESMTDLTMKLRAFACGATSLPDISLPNQAIHGSRGSVLDGTNPNLLSVAEAFMRGETIDWSTVFPDSGRRIVLPTYPFQRTRRWIDDSSVRLSEVATSSTIDRDRLQGTATRYPMLGRKLDTAGEETIFQTELSDFDFLHDHVVRGSVLFPAAGYVDLALSAVSAVDLGSDSIIGGQETAAFAIQSMRLHRPIVLKRDQSATVQVIVSESRLLNQDPSGCEVGVKIAIREGSQWSLVCECAVECSWVDSDPNECEIDQIQSGQTDGHNESLVDANEHYRTMREHGLDYGNAFSGLISRSDSLNDQACYGMVALPDGLQSQDHAFHPAWLDACFQVAASVIPDHSRAWVPLGFETVRVYRSPRPNETLKVVAKRSPGHRGEIDSSKADSVVKINLSIWDKNDQCVASIESMGLKPIQNRPAEPSSRDRDPESIDHESGPLRERLHHRIANIMGLETHEVPMQKSLDALGLDSLMAFELRDELQSQFQIEVPLEMFFEAITLDTVLDRIILQIESSEPPAEKSDDWVEGAL